MKIIAVLASCCLVLCLLCGAVLGVSENAALMTRQFETYAEDDRLGALSEKYPELAQMTTDYLRGRTDEFQYLLNLEGEELPVFHDYEQAHMKDVQGLYTLARTVFWAALAGLALSVLLLRKKTALLAGVFLKTMAVFAGVFGALVLWALIDFDSLFVLFHHLAFTNRLWLLDNSTDCLLMLMPTGFFTSYAGMIAAVWAASLLCCLVLAFLWKRRKVAP